MKFYEVTIKEERDTVIKIDSDKVRDAHDAIKKAFEIYNKGETKPDNIKTSSSFEIKNTENIKNFEITLERERTLTFDRNITSPLDALEEAMTYYEENLKYSEGEKAEFDIGEDAEADLIFIRVKITLGFSYGPKQNVYSEDDALYKVEGLYMTGIRADEYENYDLYPSSYNY